MARAAAGQDGSTARAAVTAWQADLRRSSSRSPAHPAHTRLASPPTTARQRPCPSGSTTNGKRNARSDSLEQLAHEQDGRHACFAGVEVPERGGAGAHHERLRRAHCGARLILGRGMGGRGRAAGGPKARAPFGAARRDDGASYRAGNVEGRWWTVGEAGRGLLRADAVRLGRCGRLRDASSRHGSTDAFVPTFRNARANRDR
jgi:hypothetical protein